MEEKYYYDSTDGIKLCGLLSKVNDDDSIVVLCHGLKASKEKEGFDTLVDLLQKNNINSFRFDFRSHGESTGNQEDMTPLRELEDLKSTLNLLEKMNYKRMVLLGASFGAGVISLLDINEYKCVKGLISWYGCLDYFDTIEEDRFFSDEHMQIAKEQGYYETVSKRSGNSFKLGIKLYEEIQNLVPYENLIKEDIPVLFVHGKIDKLISYTLSEKVHKLCKNSKLELIENGDHSFGNDMNARLKACNVTVDFIKEILN
jgi:pimeloyl-ACP methyl ester carboxylesterase